MRTVAVSICMQDYGIPHLDRHMLQKPSSEFRFHPKILDFIICKVTSHLAYYREDAIRKKGEGIEI